jgi:Spy/CpxP family protein refolding chaperone
MGKMQMKAALPSFPGASHIYHVGATDFFLNHPEHINLTPKQKGDLGRLKEKAVLAKTSAQRKIDEAEQELWILTAADEPDATKIEAKIQETEKLRSTQRMALIRAVGDAAKMLTDDQREALLGTATDKTAKPDPHAGHKKP